MGSAIYKTAPHDDAAEWLHCIGQHVCTISMRALIVEWSRLSLRVGFYQESAKVGNLCVNLFSLSFPPGFYLGIQWVGSLYGFAAIESLGRNAHRRGKVYRQIYLDTIGAQNIGILLYLINIYSRQHLGRGIYIIQYRTIDTDRGIGAGVFLNQFSIDRCTGILYEEGAPMKFSFASFSFPENAQSSITALDGAVQVVPVV